MKKFAIILLLFWRLGSVVGVQPDKETFKPAFTGSLTSENSAQPKLYGGGRRPIGSQPQTGARPQRPVAQPAVFRPRFAGKRRAEAGIRRGQQSENSSEKGKERIKKSGLKNLGNTCFMNSALQALYEIEPLREFIIQWGTQLYSDPLINDLSVLFKKMRDSREAVVIPEAFVQFVWHAKDKNDQLTFRTYRQGDSHEFITFLINRLVTSVKPELQNQVQKFLDDSMSYTYESVYTVPSHWHEGDEPRQEKEQGVFIELPIERLDLPLDIGRLVDTLFIPQQVELAPRRVLTYFTEVTDASLAVWDVQQKLGFREFEHLLASYKEGIKDWQYQMICAALNEIRGTREKYRNFFQIKYNDKRAFKIVLRDLVSLLKDSVREGVEKGIRLSELPPYLSLQLKLFETVHGGALRKISHHVHTPMVLRLPSVSGSLLYRLKAVVVHAGTVDRGHYYAYTRAGNLWYECNDQLVTPLTEQHVIRALGKKTPYLVFYQREDITQEFVNEQLEEFEAGLVSQIAMASEMAEPAPLMQAEQSIDSEERDGALEAFGADFQALAELI